MQRRPFNDNWFVQREHPAPAGPRLGPISLPHDAMVFENRDPDIPEGSSTGYFPGGVYRYSTVVRALEEWRRGTVVLEFEGVFHRSEVFLDGRLVGGRPSGYTQFHVPLDAHLRIGEDHELEVVAHNADQPNSRWYTGSGMIRPVNLLVGGAVHVTPTGLRVTTTAVEHAAATVEVATEVRNADDVRRHVTVRARIAREDGRTVGSGRQEVELSPGETTVVRQTIIVDQPALWSLDTPVLHTAQVDLQEGDTLLDTDATTFGIRILTLDPQHGLRLNGAVVKLRGGAVHHDNGVIGAHTLEAAEARRVRILKETGYNAIRSAHNPTSSAMLRACDRYGVLVMDELTDAWWRPVKKNDYGRDFLEWWERDLEAMIARDHNHPSVVLYSLGNEIGETASPEGVALSARMAARARALDPTRFTTNAVNGFVNLLTSQDDEKRARKAANAAAKAAEENGAPADQDGGGKLVVVVNLLVGAVEKAMHLVARLPAVDRRTRGVFATVDVAGYNYMHRRYARDVEVYPDRLILGTETQPSATAEIWRTSQRLPQVIGDFVWTAWDYIGEAGLATARYDERRRLITPFPALLAGEPIVDITGHRQTQSYVNEIIWGKTRGPVLAVQPVVHSGRRRGLSGWRTTDSVRSWSWEGLDGRQATVEVYADAAWVELKLSGRTVGTAELRTEDDFSATFTVPYRPGELTAIAYAQDGSEIGRDTLRSAGPGLRLTVHPETDGLLADGADLAYLPIELTDDDGIGRPLADRPVTVTVTGAGSLLGLGSADPASPEGFTTSTHRTYYGRALAVVRAGLTPGEVQVRVEAPGCEPVEMALPVGS